MLNESWGKFRQMKQINIGIAGFGGRGSTVAREAFQVTGGLMRTVAVMEPSDAQYEATCATFGQRPARYRSVREMCEKEPIDVLLIGSPNGCHLENLREVAGLPIPVFMEKPIDASWEKIVEVMRLARRHPAPVLVGHCMRYAPILQQAKALLAQGAIGRIGSAHFIQYCHYGNGMYHTWRRESIGGGGMMLEKATHDIDAMQWLLDARPLSVFASAKLVAYGGDKPAELRCSACPEVLRCPDSPVNITQRWVEGEAFAEISRMDDALCVYSNAVDVPDDEICLIQFEKGIHGTYSQVFYSPRSFHHRVYQLAGTLGAMEIDLGAEHGGTIRLSDRYGTTDDHTEYHFDYLHRNHYNGDGPMVRHLYDMVTAQAAPQTTLEQAFIAEALGYAAIQSAQCGQSVAVSSLVPEDLQDLLVNPLFTEKDRV